MAPIRVFCKELKAIMLIVTRKTTAIPIENVRIPMLAKSIKPVPTKIPMIVFKKIVKDKIEAASIKEAFT